MSGITVEISDGKSRGPVASVSEDARLNVSAKTNPRSFYFSRDYGRTYTLSSIIDDLAAGEYALYLKNTDEARRLFVKEVAFSGDQASRWIMWWHTGTASGTTVAPTILNRSLNVPAVVQVYADDQVTAGTIGDRISVARHGSNQCGMISFEDSLILGPNDSIIIEKDTGTTGAGEVELHFHFEPIGRAN